MKSTTELPTTTEIDHRYPQSMIPIIEKAKTIRLVVFDVDGVLTDGKLFLDGNGKEYKSFNTKDGHGMKMLVNSGVKIAVISGRASEVVSARMASLGVDHVYQGQEEKTEAFREVCDRLSVRPEQVACVGDDLPDLPLLRRAGLSIAVADAHFTVRQHADWCTSLAGGHGAAREVCDLIMQAQETLDRSVRRYLSI